MTLRNNKGTDMTAVKMIKQVRKGPRFASLAKRKSTVAQLIDAANSIITQRPQRNRGATARVAPIKQRGQSPRFSERAEHDAAVAGLIAEANATLQRAADRQERTKNIRTQKRNSARLDRALRLLKRTRSQP